MQPLKIKRLNIGRHVCVNAELCPVLFETRNLLFEPVQAGLKRIADFWWKQTKKIFTDIEPADVVIYGDLVGYVYNPFNEVSIGFLTELPPDCLQYLDEINTTLVANEFRYKFITRPIHCRLLSQIPQGISCYSLIRKDWVTLPQKRTFNFTLDELCKAFPEYENIVHAFINSLPKHENGLLTIEGCRQLEDYLHNLRQKAVRAWESSEEHEYDLDYLLWRTFKEVGGVRYFTIYLADSYNHNINELEQC